MVLQEVFDQLTSTELSQVSIGGQQPGVINAQNWKKIIPHLQSGLTELYKRFKLKEGQIYVTLLPGITVYPLTDRPTHGIRPLAPVQPSGLPPAMTSPFGSAPDPASANQVNLADTSVSLGHGDVFLFKEDILKIERVYTDYGVELPLNDLGRKWSVRTPDHQTLQVPAALAAQKADLPCELKGDRLTVFYRANHPNLVARYGPYLLDEAEYEPHFMTLELPDAYLEPLIFYIASRYHNPIGMGQEFNAGNTYAQKFEMACRVLKGLNLEQDQDDSSDKLHRRGFV